MKVLKSFRLSEQAITYVTEMQNYYQKTLAFRPSEAQIIEACIMEVYEKGKEKLKAE